MIEETSEKIYISADFPDEYANSESRIALKGAVAKAKANAAQAIPELVKIATNPQYEENRKKYMKRMQSMDGIDTISVLRFLYMMIGQGELPDIIFMRPTCLSVMRMMGKSICMIF